MFQQTYLLFDVISVEYISIFIVTSKFPTSDCREIAENVEKKREREVVDFPHVLCDCGNWVNYSQQTLRVDGYLKIPF